MKGIYRFDQRNHKETDTCELSPQIPAVLIEAKIPEALQHDLKQNDKSVINKKLPNGIHTIDVEDEKSITRYTEIFIRDAVSNAEIILPQANGGKGGYISTNEIVLNKEKISNFSTNNEIPFQDLIFTNNPHVKAFKKQT